MRIVSQNLINYNFPVPDDVVFRINLAWCNSLDELKLILSKHHDSSIFLDLPIGRLKPPNNKYTLKDIIPILEEHKNIKYFAVSNVESASHLTLYMKTLPKHIVIVPKIESPNAIDNIKEIAEALNPNEKVMMLDHDDLFSAILRRNEPEKNFLNYIVTLNDFCKENKIILLRTIGVVFSNDENYRATQYVK